MTSKIHSNDTPLSSLDIPSKGTESGIVALVFIFFFLWIFVFFIFGFILLNSKCSIKCLIHTYIAGHNSSETKHMLNLQCHVHLPKHAVLFKERAAGIEPIMNLKSVSQWIESNKSKRAWRKFLFWATNKDFPANLQLTKTKDATWNNIAREKKVL